MKIAILAAGAGGMYCGSCMRDNALATALKRQGHDVTLIPLYTPLTTDAAPEPPAARAAAAPPIFYGGINVYLQHASRLFRKTPRLFDWLLDRPWLLKLAGSYGASTPPERLGGLTMDILRGEEGASIKELRRLLQFLKAEVNPQVVTLPNLMFVGMARLMREELGVPVVCELAGEDIFLDAMSPADRKEIRGVIRQRSGDVTKFVATSGYYAGQMAAYLNVPRESIDVVYPGIPAGSLRPGPKPGAAGRKPRKVGYMARICPEKGFHHFVDAAARLKASPATADVEALAAGHLGKGHRKWAEGQRHKLNGSLPAGWLTVKPDVDLAEKVALLDEVDVLSVPTVYPEAKGIFVLEALARGTPVVQPAHGSFPELVNLTGGGVLVPPGDPAALAGALGELLNDEPRRRALGEAGRQAVAGSFTDDHMARNMLKVYESVLQ